MFIGRLGPLTIAYAISGRAMWSRSATPPSRSWSAERIRRYGFYTRNFLYLNPEQNIERYANNHG